VRVRMTAGPFEVDQSGHSVIRPAGPST
jgi:hypothetical protein